jgi:hypothetical protein
LTSSSANSIFAIIQIVYVQRYFFPGIRRKKSALHLSVSSF